MSSFTVSPAPSGAVPPIPAPAPVEVTIPAPPAQDLATPAPPIVSLTDVTPTAVPHIVSPPRRETPAVADSVRALAERHGVDLSTVTPTGRGGKITRKDVENALAATESTSETAAAVGATAIAQGPTAVLTLNLVARDGHAVRIATAEDLLALAREHLPQLPVVGAALELTGEGTVLLAEITTTLEVQL